jgi:hypothetical protein
VRRPGIPITVATAWVGVVVGHLAAYLLAYPAQGPRHAHLAITGHRWVGLATMSLLAVVPVVVLAVAVRSFRTERAWSGSALALRLMAIQIPAFALIEVVERRGSLSRTLADPAVFVGLVLQPLAAVLVAWVLDLVRRAARAVMVRLRPTYPPVLRSFPRPALEHVPSRRRLLLPTRRRAPPLLRPA